MKLTQSTNDQLMATAAHRYCLGRKSYIVGSCQEWIRDTWDQFSDNTKQVMVRDTLEWLIDGKDEFDESWKSLCRKMVDKLTPEQLEWVRHAIAFRNSGTVEEILA